VRRVIFGIALASFVLSFFHIALAPAAIGDELTRAFAINSAALGTLAAAVLLYYVYTVPQIPVGVLADTMGPRRPLAAGSLVAGLGSISSRWRRPGEIAAAGRARWSASASRSPSSRSSR
jgi:MFS family permease